MATITTRKLDPVTWEPLYGNGQSNFISDVDAVAQIIAQRLKLFEGEWWEALTEGLPLWQQIMGYGGGGSNQQAINLLIEARILGTPFVTGLNSVQSSYDPGTRSYKFYAVAETQFGTSIVVTNFPTPPSRAIPQ